MKQTCDWEMQIVGRTGDDGLAFRRDEEGHIIAWLACEAKCTRNHSSTLIKDNHAKLNQAVTRPVDLLRLIRNLGDVVELVDLWELPGYPLVFQFSKGGIDSKAA